MPQDAHNIKKIASEINTMTDALCELRQQGKGATPQAESLARGIKDKLGYLQQAVLNAVVAVDKAGLQQTAHTVQGRYANVTPPQVLSFLLNSSSVFF